MARVVSAAGFCSFPSGLSMLVGPLKIFKMVFQCYSLLLFFFCCEESWEEQCKWRQERNENTPKSQQKLSYRHGEMADPSGRPARHHPAVSDVFSTLADARAALANVQRRLDLEFGASYPDHVNPAKLVARVKRIQEEVAALKELCRDLLAQKQELIDKMQTSLAAQRSATRRLLAASGLPPVSEADAAAHNSLNEVIDEWTVHVRPITGENKMENTNQILFSTMV